MIERGSSVRLIQSFTDEWGFVHPQGERGKVLWIRENAGIEFEGYEAERAEDAGLIAKNGEGYNIVPWLAEVPLALLIKESA